MTSARLRDLGTAERNLRLSFRPLSRAGGFLLRIGVGQQLLLWLLGVLTDSKHSVFCCLVCSERIVKLLSYSQFNLEAITSRK
jgi:hypothetical protein